MYFHLVFLFPILQRNDEEAVVDRGGTRSILKTHFEKEDLEGKTFPPLGIAILIFVSKRMWNMSQCRELQQSISEYRWRWMWLFWCNCNANRQTWKCKNILRQTFTEPLLYSLFQRVTINREMKRKQNYVRLVNVVVCEREE